MNISEKLVANIFKSIVLLACLGIVLPILFGFYHVAFTGFIANGLVLLIGTLSIVYFMLDDIMELREALQNNDLKKLADMRDKALLALTLYGLMSMMIIIVIIRYPISAVFGLNDYIKAFIVILLVAPLAHEAYIIKKTSPGAERWRKETAEEAYVIELLNKNRPKKKKTMGAAS